MYARLLELSDHAYRFLLRAYPKRFRDRFAGEMAQVFGQLCRDACAGSRLGGLARLWLATGWDWLGAVMVQWWLRLARRKEFNNMHAIPNTPGDEIKPLPAFQSGLAILPFLLFGLSSLVMKLNIFQPEIAASLPLWQVLTLQPFLAFNWLVLIGLGIAILAGFPRWGYSYLGWAVLFGWWWTNMSFFGNRAGWKIWLPLLGVLLVAALIRRSIQPLRNLVAGLWKDWTLLSFAIYILYSWVFMLYDENHHPYLLAFVAITTLATCLGAWGYFRSTSPFRRILSLVVGLLFATITNGINTATWDYRAYYGLPTGGTNENLVGVIFFAILAVIMLANGLLALWRLARHNGSKQIES